MEEGQCVHSGVKVNDQFGPPRSYFPFDNRSRFSWPVIASLEVFKESLDTDPVARFALRKIGAVTGLPPRYGIPASSLR